jgi:hypothetical protein
LRTTSASARSTVCRFSEANAGHPDQRALELADVARDLRGDELEHVRRSGQPVLRGLLAQDGDAGLEVGRLDVGLQAPLEAGAQPVLQGRQLLGRPVRADHDLLVGVVQRVEGVEELLLGAFLVLQELDVVDEQDVDVAVAAAEVLRLAVPDRVDEVVGELLGAHVAHPGALEQVLGVVADGVQQVGLAEPAVAVDEQRVVGPGRRLGDRHGRGVREAVGRPDDEGVEGVLGVEPGRLGGALRSTWPGGRPGEGPHVVVAVREPGARPGSSKAPGPAAAVVRAVRAREAPAP